MRIQKIREKQKSLGLIKQWYRSNLRKSNESIGYEIFTDCDHTISQSLDYGSNKFVTLEQNFDDLMTEHKTQAICSSLDLELSLKKPSVTSTKFLG